MAQGPTQPPIQWIPRALTLGIKAAGHEAEKALTCIWAQVKNTWRYTSTSPIGLHSMVLN